LPEFRSKEMLKPSSSRTHAFNEALPGLKHYAFRQLLAAKCKLLGKTLVDCSDMYTSLTCGRCSKLHIRLGSSRSFRCPQPDCGRTAGRDVNAAFNILRFVVGRSLETFAVHH
jgi:putative transposase